MIALRPVAIALALVAMSFVGSAAAQQNSASPETVVELSAEVLRDKIRGGLLGQMLGNLNGIPHEMRYIDEPGNVTEYEPALPEGAWTDDDTDFEWVYIDAMQRTGEVFIPHGEIADLWRTRINRRIWCSNQYARVLMDLGLEPPMTGSIALNPWAEFNISGQFLCESFGLIAPGMPQTAGRIGLHYTRVAIDGEPAQTTQMFTAMIATSFFTQDVERLLAAGVAALDPRSVLREIVGDVRTWHRAHPDDWRTTRRFIKEKYSKYGGEMRDRNGYELNSAATIAALAYGAGDFAETLRHAFNFGWDADNTAATAGTVVGVMKGYRWMMAQGWDIRDRYRNETREGMPEDETITSFADRLIEVAERVIVEQGGERAAGELGTVYRIPVEEPANVYPLPRLSGQVARLRAEMKDEIESAIADGGEPRAQARAAYLSIALGLADSIRATRPEQWSRALAALNGFPQVGQVLYHHSPVPAAEPLRERARRAGLEPPHAEDEEWIWRATATEGERYLARAENPRALPAGRMTSTSAVPIILDTDIGDDIDDTWALAMLLGMPEVDIKLISVASDDTPAKTRLVAKFLEVAGRTDIPIATGPKTSDRELKQGAWIGDYDLGRYPGKVYNDGVGAFIDTVHGSDRPITILVIGPQTNLKAALDRDPSIAKKARVVTMAGSIDIGYDGEPEPEPEWNVVKDTKAAQAVFAAPWEITMAPLDICGTLRLEGERYLRVARSTERRAMALIANYNLWQHRRDHPANASSILFDTVAAYLVVDDKYVECETIRLTVDDNGFTRRDPEKGRPVRCAMRWKDRDAFEEYLVTHVAVTTRQ